MERPYRSAGWLAAGIVVAAAAAASAQPPRVPLIEAVKTGDAAAVRTLLDRGADVNAAEPDGTTALHWAAHNEDLDVAARLVEAGAEVDATTRYGVAPLALAATNGSPETLRMLPMVVPLPRAASPLMLTILPQPWRRMWGAASRAQRM